jgi:hypothetical protein
LPKKVGCGGGAVLLGFFTVSACFVVVNRGEVMVGCVTNVARGTTLFRGFKIGQDRQIYF